MGYVQYRAIGVVLAMATMPLVAVVGGCGDSTSRRTELAPLSTSDSAADSESSCAAYQVSMGRSVDPPSRFDSEAGVVLDGWNDPSEVLIHGDSIAFPVRSGNERSAVTAVCLVDTRDGVVQTSVTPTNPLAGVRIASTLPSLATVGGEDTLFVPFLEKTDASGDVSEYLIEIIMVDPESGTVDQTVSVALDEWENVGVLNQAEIAVVGVTDEVAVVSMTAGTGIDSDGTTVIYAVDLETGQTLWSKSDIPYFGNNVAVADSVIAVIESSTTSEIEGALVGLDARTGQRVWAGENMSIPFLVQIGPSTAAIWGQHGIGVDTYLNTLQIATGTVLDAQSTADGDSVPDLAGCVYDEKSVAVCWGVVDHVSWLGGLDVTTGGWLWSFTESTTRLVPRITSAWHGAVYGYTSIDGAGYGSGTRVPIVLAAEAGAELQAQPGAIVYATNGSIAVGATTRVSGEAALYPVLG